MTAPLSPPRRLRVLGGRVSLRVDRRASLVCVGLAALAVVVGVFSLGTGDYPIPAVDVVRTLLGHGDPALDFIVRELRLPRLLTAVLVGVAFGVGGALFQSMSRNPLGSPDVVGFDTGAATGALVVIVLIGGSGGQVAIGAVVGGIVTAMLVYLLAVGRGGPGFRLILIGIAVGALAASVNAYLITRAEYTDAREGTLWLTGSLDGRGWEQVRPLAVVLLVLLPVALYLGRELRFLELGDEAARALGVPVGRTRLGVVLVGVGLTATATASAGPIAFIALTAPQVARRLTRADGPNVVASAATGAALLLVSDLAAQRLFHPVTLPVGVLTAGIGGLYLAGLLARQWRKGLG
ncbi:FecCD family ABC transporter permease [Micromonospora sp. NPDC050397]|uniref:FecCD family ABC transporter permease n=1 Tax=Micromonospora sp. NPDC050397 TaxID=3364279 RepID=UPI00384C0BCA